MTTLVDTDSRHIQPIVVIASCQVIHFERVTPAF